MNRAKLWTMLLAVGLMLAFTGAGAVGQEAPRIDKDTLKSWLGKPQVTVVDVRQSHDWEASTKKIKGAVRQDPNTVKVWAAGLPKNQKIVVYCA